MNNAQYIFKNGGFPSIKYCQELDIKKSSKARFFHNTPKQNINIRQLLYESTNKKPLIIPERTHEDTIEVVNSL